MPMRKLQMLAVALLSQGFSAYGANKVNIGDAELLYEDIRSRGMKYIDAPCATLRQDSTNIVFLGYPFDWRPHYPLWFAGCGPRTC